MERPGPERSLPEPTRAQEPTFQGLEPIGLGAPDETSTKAAGADAASAPGVESADVVPKFPGPDLGVMNELQGVLGELGSGGTPGAPPPSSGGGGTGKWGNYSLPGVKPYVLQSANELGGRFGIKSIGGIGDRPNKSDHPHGKALDFMVRGTPGDQLAAFAMQNAKRMKIKYIIWKQHIWSVGRAGEGWRKMEDRGGATANHFDHVHISYY